MGVYISITRWIIEVVKRKLCATQDDILDYKQKKPSTRIALTIENQLLSDAFAYSQFDTILFQEFLYRVFVIVRRK